MKSVNTLEPLGLNAQLELAEVNTLSLEWVPYLNLLVLMFGLVLLNSRWLCPPGVQLQLPKVSTVSAYGTALPAGDVLLMDADKRLFFRHKPYNFAELEQVFSKKKSDSLLLKADERLSLGDVLHITISAKEHGYRSVQLAVDIENE